MTFISKQSVEALKDKIDLVDVISSFIKLTRSGSHYKAHCPFHHEKSPSFSIGAGDRAYHCFGCGAHGDAISFLMEYSKLSFKEALSYLAQKYQVTLEEDKGDEGSRVSKNRIKEALSLAEEFYHFCLLYTQQGEKALSYAFERSLNRALIEQFKLGYSPKNGALSKFLQAQGIDFETMADAGLLHFEKKTDFFFDRFMIPIHDSMGACIGFSARKLDPDSFGGKYINTPETAVFKKSHVLFGLKCSRAKIIKDKKALVCEGQIDAMRLIYEGYDYTVASQGTAFGQAHVEMLKKLGVTQVYLAFDGDHAGVQAAIKVGELFMKEQMSVHVLSLPMGQDPDSFLLEKGKKAFDELLSSSQSFLEFLYESLKINYDLSEPSEKNRLITELKNRIFEFKDPVLIHESLKRLAQLADIPERVLGLSSYRPSNRQAPIDFVIDKDQIADQDVLRFFYLAKLQNLPCVKLFTLNVLEFASQKAQALFEAILNAPTLETIPFMSSLDPLLHEDFEALFKTKVNRLKLEEGAKGVVYKLLERSWLKQRQALGERIQNTPDEQQQKQLLLEHSLLVKTPPALNC